MNSRQNAPSPSKGKMGLNADRMVQDFDFLASVNLLCCVQCQVCVFADGIRAHLKTNSDCHVPHSTRQAETTQSLVQAKWPTALLLHQAPLGGSAGVQSLLDNNHQPVPPFPHLPVAQDGLLCSACAHVCLGPKAMEKHHQISHPRPAPRPHFVRDVPYQRFTHGGPLSSRFAVLFETAAEKRQLERDGNALCRTLDEALADRAEKERQRLTRPSNLPLDQIPPLAKNTGWASLFDGYDFEVLSDLVRPPPTASETAPPSIEAVAWAVMTHVALAASQNCRDASSTLRFEMHRTTIEATLEPFRCPDLASSIIAYARTWVRVVLFFFRTSPGEGHACPRYELTDAQAEALTHLRSLLFAALKQPEWRWVVASNPPADAHPAAEGEADVREGEEAAIPPTVAGKGDAQEPFLELDGVHRACLDFCLSLLCRKTQQNDFEQPLIVALSCMGVSKHGWVAAGIYTQYLSAVVTLGNIMFLQGAIHSANARGSHPPPVREELGKLKDGWGVRGSAAPMEWVLNKRAYGFSIHNAVGGPSRFLLENGRIHFRENHIHHVEFAALVQGHLRRTEETLAKLLLVESVGKLPPPPLRLMVDNPYDDEPGASIARVWQRVDEGKAVPDADHWLCGRVMADPKQSARYLDPETQRANENALRRFLRSEEDFLDQLMALIHLTYGAPARGTELLSVRHTKTPFAERNVIISHGHVCLLIEYNKRGWTPIHRFLPEAVGRLVLWYLTFARPFSERVRSHLDPDGISSPYLWHATSDDRAFTTARLSKNLGQLFRQANVKDVGVKDYRQMATIWMREHCVETMMAFGDDQAPAGGGTEDGADWATAIMDQQFGHSSTTAAMHYGRLDTSPFFQRPGVPSLKGYMLGSVAWFKFCGFAQQDGAVGMEGSDVQDERDRSDKASRDRQLTIRDGLANVDLLAALRRMYATPDADFRGKQLEALRCIVAGHRCVVVVLPTGAGKSLLYQLPAFTGLAGLTIVVSPYLALLNDQAAKCLPYRINHFVWDGKQNPPHQPHLLFVTPESFVLPPFQGFMNAAIARYRLHRVVIDEFHECRSAFREAQRRLGSCIDHTVQIVALTATLEPRHEDEVLRMFDLPRAHAKIVRQVTTQANHGYSVVKVEPSPDAGRSLARVVSLIEDRIAELEGVHTRNPQFLVFCHTKAEVEELAVALGAEPFYARIAGGKETMARFLAGSIRILVSTSAAATGLDGQGRIFVFFKGAPKTLQEVAQGGGRGARDGLLGAVVVLSGPHLDMGNPDEGMREFLRSDQCHRIAMDRFDEPRDRSGCELGEVPCDHCHARNAEKSRVLGTPPLAAEVGAAATTRPPPSLQPFDLGFPRAADGDMLVRGTSPADPRVRSASSFGSFGSVGSVGSFSARDMASSPPRPGDRAPRSSTARVPSSSSPSSEQHSGGGPRRLGSAAPGSNPPLSAMPLKRGAPSSPWSSSSKRWASSSSSGSGGGSIGAAVSRLELAVTPARASQDRRLFFVNARQDEENSNAQNLRAQSARRRADRLRELERKLDVLANLCIACGSTHTANRCSNPHPAGLSGAMPSVDLIRQRFNTGRYLAPYCACFKCLAPLATCASWTVREDGFGYDRSPGPYQCRQGILETFAIMWHHLQPEYREYMRDGEWRIDTADAEAHLVHLGRACPGFERGNEMMTMMMVQLEWMVDFLALRYGPLDDWGGVVLPRGLIGMSGA